MHVPAIRSQPVYPPLEWDRAGRRHLVFVANDDAQGTRGLQSALPAGELTVIHLRGALGAEFAGWLADAGHAVERRAAVDLSDAIERLGELLETAHVGLRLYLIGPEDAIWPAMQAATRHGMNRDEVRLCRSGSLARPVYCVHCRHVTRGVRSSIAACGGCGASLFVRDHFSRRLGAYMGFRIDSEVPGEVPAAEIVYP